MLEQILSQLTLLTILLSVLGWMLANMLGQKKSPFWLIGWLAKRSLRGLRSISKSTSRQLQRAKTNLLKLRTDSTITRVLFILFAITLGVAGSIIAIPAVIIGELPLGNKKS